MGKVDRKHTRFALAYIRLRYNGTQAYKEVYGKDLDDNSAAVNASKLLRDTKVRKIINDELEAKHLSTEEALEILASHAKSDTSKFLNEDGDIDVNKLKEAGLGHLIKEIEVIETVSDKGASSRRKIKLHDPQNAINMILRVQGKFKDTIDVNMKKVIKVSIKKDK